MDGRAHRTDYRVEEQHRRAGDDRTAAGERHAGRKCRGSVALDHGGAEAPDRAGGNFRSRRDGLGREARQHALEQRRVASHRPPLRARAVEGGTRNREGQDPLGTGLRRDPLVGVARRR